jgi:hypothetical protein
MSLRSMQPTGPFAASNMRLLEIRRGAVTREQTISGGVIAGIAVASFVLVLISWAAYRSRMQGRWMSRHQKLDDIEGVEVLCPTNPAKATTEQYTLQAQPLRLVAEQTSSAASIVQLGVADTSIASNEAVAEFNEVVEEMPKNGPQVDNHQSLAVTCPPDIAGSKSLPEDVVDKPVPTTEDLTSDERVLEESDGNHHASSSDQRSRVAEKVELEHEMEDPFGDQAVIVVSTANPTMVSHPAPVEQDSRSPEDLAESISRENHMLRTELDILRRRVEELQLSQVFEDDHESESPPSYDGHSARPSPPTLDNQE